MIHYIYRISNAGKQPKRKLDFATKEFCLNNFLTVFGTENVWVIADNCTSDLVEYMHNLSLHVVETKTGNSKGVLYAIKMVIEKFKEDDFVYFVEDDYIHLEGSKEVLISGLKTADYVTLYDNVDYYGHYKNSGLSPYSRHGGQVCKLYVTEMAHFRTAYSTTMTFAAKIKTLREDVFVWEVITSGIFRNKYPYDFAAFLSLTKAPLFPLFRSVKQRKFLRTFVLVIFLRLVRILRKKRTLLVPVPGFSTHTDLIGLAPLKNWNDYKSKLQ